MLQCLRCDRPYLFPDAWSPQRILSRPFILRIAILIQGLHICNYRDLRVTFDAAHAVALVNQALRSRVMPHPLF